jgi:hypothetical protein
LSSRFDIAAAEIHPEQLLSAAAVPGWSCAARPLRRVLSAD